MRWANHFPWDKYLPLPSKQCHSLVYGWPKVPLPASTRFAGNSRFPDKTLLENMSAAPQFLATNWHLQQTFFFRETTYTYTTNWTKQLLLKSLMYMRPSSAGGPCMIRCKSHCWAPWFIVWSTYVVISPCVVHSIFLPFFNMLFSLWSTRCFSSYYRDKYNYYMILTKIQQETV
jgi:hypothetical protein